MPTSPSTLILLTCHSIYTTGPPDLASSWLLAPFQSGLGTAEHLTFISHIQLAFTLLNTPSASPINPSTSTPTPTPIYTSTSATSPLLVISGGYTKSCIRKSEARSYFEVGMSRGFWKEEDLGVDVVLEEGALDSFGNLLGGMIMFWRVRGEWPERVEVISHEFKRARFEELHARALVLRVGRESGSEGAGAGGRGGGGEEEEKGDTKKAGNDKGDADEKCDGSQSSNGKADAESKSIQLIFHGINPSYMNPDNPTFDAGKCDETRKGEWERGYREWKVDLWGTGRVLRGKRDMRDAWAGSGNSDGRALFATEEERMRSGVRTRWLEAEGELCREEVILEGTEMPWGREKRIRN